MNSRRDTANSKTISPKNVNLLDLNVMCYNFSFELF